MAISDVSELKIVLYCGKPSQHLDDIRDHVSGLGAQVFRQPSIQRLINEFSDTAPPNACTVINLDDFGGITEVIDDLLEWRLLCPDLPTILLSGEFEVDDFDLDRLPVCDCSIKYTSNPASLHLALKQSLLNNAVWFNRQGLETKIEIEDELRLIGALMISSVAALISGAFVLFEMRDWVFALISYISVGQLTLFTIAFSPLVRSRAEGLVRIWNRAAGRVSIGVRQK